MLVFLHQLHNGRTVYVTVKFDTCEADVAAEHSEVSHVHTTTVWPAVVRQ